ncbi:MAG: peptidylprolyl isomerase [Pirellulales bacterium]
MVNLTRRPSPFFQQVVKLCLASLLLALASQAFADDKPRPKTSAKAQAGQKKPPKSTSGKSSAKTASPQEKSAVVATVDGQPIYASEIERKLGTTSSGDRTQSRPSPLLVAHAVDLAVQQRLIERALKREKLLPTPEQLNEALEQTKQDALAKFPTWEDYLRQRGQSEDQLRWLLAWRWGWNAYLAEHLTDKVRQEYFDRHRVEFDGTELRVSHILLKIPSSGDDALPATQAKADEIRGQIVEGQITFADAAQKFSAGPSSKEGGDLGFIPRRGPMSDEFAQAAFALQAGEISPPVVSPFGVHLIQVTEVRPGDKTWQDARAELEPRVVQHLFTSLAASERAKAKVEYSGAMPYLDPKTGQVVEKR